MTAGQVAFSVAADVAALDACGAELAVWELDRGALHVRQLRGLLRMHAVGLAAGMDLSTVPHAALALGASEARTGGLLSDALLLRELPGALEAVVCGLLSVEMSQTVVRVLSPVPFPVRRQVWERLRARLIALAEAGGSLPPARLGELLRGWVIQADAEAAEQRRREAEQDRRLVWRRHEDGLADLFAFGMTGPNLQAVLSRIRNRACPVGPEDDRTAEQRRFDAFQDLLLGRDPLPLDDPHDPNVQCACAASPAGGGRAGCGCLPGSPAPCGAELLVHVPLNTALGSSDQPAELVGYGPIEPDLLQALLLAAPRLRRVVTDSHGVPIAVDDQVLLPQRDDPASVRAALLRLADLPAPPERHPRHPHDHPREQEPEPPGVRLQRPRTDQAPPDDAARLGAVALGHAHPAGTPGAYRPSRRLRRLIEVRAPRCEWPGCGARAVRCDAEHDLAWPAGPTCGCNLGPCCRRHHRVKQHGWTKTRAEGAAVSWTSPGRGGRWVSPAQHQPPAAPIRLLPPVPADDPFAQLSPLQQQESGLGVWPTAPTTCPNSRV